MNTVATPLSWTDFQGEQRRRTEAVRAGIASARIEGDDVGPEPQAIVNEGRRCRG